MTPATEGRPILHHHTANLHCPGHPCSLALGITGSSRAHPLGRLPAGVSPAQAAHPLEYQRLQQFWGYRWCPVPARPLCREPRRRGAQEGLEHHHGNHGCQQMEAQGLCGTGRLRVPQTGGKRRMMIFTPSPRPSAAPPCIRTSKGAPAPTPSRLHGGVLSATAACASAGMASRRLAAKQSPLWWVPSAGSSTGTSARRSPPLAPEAAPAPRALLLLPDGATQRLRRERHLRPRASLISSSFWSWI